MKKLLQLFATGILLLSFANTLKAQEETLVEDNLKPNFIAHRNRSINIEFLGSNRYYAVNFEQVFLRTRVLSIYGSVGGTLLPALKLGKSTPYNAIGYNAEVGALLGSKRNKLELGWGYGFSYKYYGKLDLSFPVQENSTSLTNQRLTFTTFKVGYRHVFKKERLYIRAAASLSYRIANSYIYNNACGYYDPWVSQTWLPMMGFGVGYSF